MHEVADAHGEGDAGGQDHQRTDDGMAGRGMQRLTQQDAHQCDEGRGGDLLEAAGQAVPPAQQQVAAGRQTGHGGSDGAAQITAKDHGKAERAAHAADQLHPFLGEGDALGGRQTVLSLPQRHIGLGDLAGKGVHRRHPAQMGGAHRHVAHFADLCGAGAGKNAVGQYINMELPQVEGACHDLHGLLHPEHFRTVLQQGLPGRHDKIHDAAAQFFVGISLSALHCPASLKK